MRVKLCCRTHDVDSREEEIFYFPDDITTEQLEQEAEEYYINAKQPEWWYEILESEAGDE
jgi:hypothetical protein